MAKEWAIVRDAFRKFFQDDGPFLASGLAFGLLVFCIPFGLLSVSVLSFALSSSDTAFFWLRQLTATLIPHSHKEFDAAIAGLVEKRILLSGFGFVAFAFASSATFGSVRLVMNRVFRAREQRGVIHGKFMEFVMMLGASAVIFVFAGAVYFVNVVHSFVATFGYERFISPGLELVVRLVSLLSTFALFWFLYRFSPAKTLSRRGLLVAAMTATALFQLSKWAFGAYLQYAKTATAIYGAFGAAVFLLLWLYYASVVFILAAEFGWSFDRKG
jgi:membrane protein